MMTASIRTWTGRRETIPVNWQINVPNVKGDLLWDTRRQMGVLRITYVIDEEGKIAHAFGKVKTNTHSKDVIAAVDAIALAAPPGSKTSGDETKAGPF